MAISLEAAVRMYLLLGIVIQIKINKIAVKITSFLVRVTSWE